MVLAAFGESAIIDGEAIVQDGAGASASVPVNPHRLKADIVEAALTRLTHRQADVVGGTSAPVIGISGHCARSARLQGWQYQRDCLVH